MFLCCHPGLPPASQVVLTLKTVGGLGVHEIGAALLRQPATVAQRLVRAKRWLRTTPSSSRCDPSRVDSVLAVLYLLFNAGYDAADGDSAVRGELCDEAIRLCRLLRTDRRTDLPRTRALLALMLLQASRLGARTDADGDILLLSDQDRTRWDRGMIAEGTRVFAGSCTGDERSAFHVEAAIALCHTMAPDVEHTDWARIVALYDDLLALKPSPVAALNRAIAAAMAGELDHRELARLEREPALRDYHLLPAALGALWLRAGEPETAAGYYREALTKQVSAPTRRFLERQLDRCCRPPERVIPRGVQHRCGQPGHDGVNAACPAADDPVGYRFSVPGGSHRLCTALSTGCGQTPWTTTDRSRSGGARPGGHPRSTGTRCTARRRAIS